MRLFGYKRKSLLIKGQIRKYLIYAVGEIILITIGVLLAWKIGDLNDIRKNKIVEEKIYEGLHEELQANIKVLDTAIPYYQESILTQENILNYVGLTEKELSAEARDSIINVNYQEIKLLEGATNAVINSTKFEYIESDSLKEKLLAYPNELNEFNSQQALINKSVKDRLQPILEEYLSLKDILPNHAYFNKIKSLGSNSNYAGLLQSMEYQNAMIDRLLQTIIQIENANRLHRETEELIKILEKELN